MLFQVYLRVWFTESIVKCEFGYLPEESATMFAEVQGVAIFLLLWIMFLQGEVHELPVHIVIVALHHIPTELKETTHLKL